MGIKKSVCISLSQGFWEHLAWVSSENSSETWRFYPLQVHLHPRLTTPSVIKTWRNTTPSKPARQGEAEGSRRCSQQLSCPVSPALGHQPQPQTRHGQQDGLREPPRLVERGQGGEHGVCRVPGQGQVADGSFAAGRADLGNKKQVITSYLKNTNTNAERHMENNKTLAKEHSVQSDYFPLVFPPPTPSSFIYWCTRRAISPAQEQHFGGYKDDTSILKLLFSTPNKQTAENQWWLVHIELTNQSSNK